jgi:hypothetical protein
MGKNVVIAVLLLAVVWLAATVARLENFHYASAVGMCGEFNAQDPIQNAKRHSCLHAIETRSSPLWHLFYALRGE